MFIGTEGFCFWYCCAAARRVESTHPLICPPVCCTGWNPFCPPPVVPPPPQAATTPGTSAAPPASDAVRRPPTFGVMSYSTTLWQVSDLFCPLPCLRQDIALISLTHSGGTRGRCTILRLVARDEGDNSVTGAPVQNRDTASYRPGYELIAERIRQFIAESGLRPGDRMPTENELAAQLGTSRSVVREAVKILSAIGRVRAQKGRGLYVADDDGMLGSSRWGGFFLPTDLDHVYMLFEFRRVQELAASRLAATRATPAGLRAIGAGV